MEYQNLCIWSYKVYTAVPYIGCSKDNKKTKKKKFKSCWEIRGVIQINPESIYLSAAEALARNHMKIKNHHTRILYHFCFNQYGYRIDSKLPTEPQRSDVSSTPAKTAIRRVQDFFLEPRQKPNK
jgi:hypothetical protein